MMIRVLIVCLSFCCISTSRSNTLNLYDLTLEELLNVKVTIANLSEQTTLESSASVTVYTREDIRKMGISTLEELLNYIPGVQTSRRQENGLSEAPVFRGHAQKGNSHGILLMLDGRRLNNHVDGGAFGQPLNNLDWIKQVEIIRGPGSVLYGANAFTGVINLISEIKESEVKARSGSLGISEISLQYKNSIEDLAIEFYLHDYQDDGEEYDAFYHFLTSFDDTQDPRSRDTVALNLDYDDWYYKGYYSKAISDDFVNSSNIGNGINKIDEQIINHRLGYSGFSAKNWNIEMHADYMEGTSDLFIRIIPADLASEIWWSDGSAIDAVGGNHLNWNYKQVGASGNYETNEDHLLSFGLEFRDEWVDVNPFHGNWVDEVMVSSQGSTLLPCECISEGFWLPGTRADLLLESSRLVKNGWLQDRWRISGELNATIGVRYDHYDDFGGNTSLRAALVYQHTSATQFKMLYGEAFRAPTFIESRAFISSTNVGNPDLQPETINTVDLVWQQRVNAANIVFTWSKSHIEDEIRLVPFEDELQPGVVAFMPQNTGKSGLENVEIELNASLSEAIMLRAGFTHLIEYIEQGTSKNLAYLSLNYSDQKWNMNLNAFYHDKVLSREVDDINYSDDIYLAEFWRFNLSLNYHFTDNLTFELRAENLFNEDYKTFTSTDGGLEFGLPTRGRILSAGVNWSP